MTPSLLVLIGALDALIAIIQSEREVLGKSFDPEAAVQTLKKIKHEFVSQVLASTRAQLLVTESFRSTVDLLVAGLPQGSDSELLVRALQNSVLTFLPQGPTPPWPSSSSSKSPLGLAVEHELLQLIERLRALAEPKAERQ